jgi:hypothetical protein
MQIDCGQRFGSREEDAAGEVPAALALVPIIICLMVLYFVGAFG